MAQPKLVQIHKEPIKMLHKFPLLYYFRKLTDWYAYSR